MTKQEFINDLRISLTGRMDTNKLNENIRYYEDYITAETRKGRAEEDVISDIGDPNAIAISLIDAEERLSGNTNSSSESYSEYDTSKETEAKPSLWLRLIAFVLKHPVLSIVIILAIILVIIVLAIWLAISILTQFWPLILILVLAGVVGFLVYSIIKILHKS